MEFFDGSFNTKALDGGSGYAWSLPSRIGRMLSYAEDLFGARDKTWTILGVEICMDSTVPQNWYPGSFEGRQNIIFQLVPPADKDLVTACFQLSHEVVHALSPALGHRCNVLEEGVASWFSEYYLEKELGICRSYVSLPSYKAANALVKSLLAMDQYAIKKLRCVEPCFCKITRDTFEKAAVVCSDNEIAAMLTPFVREMS